MFFDTTGVSTGRHITQSGLRLKADNAPVKSMSAKATNTVRLPHCLYGFETCVTGRRSAQRTLPKLNAQNEFFAEAVQEGITHKRDLAFPVAFSDYVKSSSASPAAHGVALR